MVTWIILAAGTVSVDGVTVSASILLALVGAISGYATLRANSQRNTTRINDIETKTIPGLQAEIDRLKDYENDVKEWRAYLKGKERGAAGSSDSTTKTWEGRRQR